jgi:DNA-binding GntR family transcriptional regulator
MKRRRSAVPYRDRVSDQFRIDPNAPKLVYVQVADHITGRIAAGDLAPGARLPAERDLATEYGVAYDTIRRATALLRERGLIHTIVGRGTYVTPEDQRSR